MKKMCLRVVANVHVQFTLQCTIFTIRLNRSDNRSRNKIRLFNMEFIYWWQIIQISFRNCFLHRRKFFCGISPGLVCSIPCYCSSSGADVSYVNKCLLFFIQMYRVLYFSRWHPEGIILNPNLEKMNFSKICVRGYWEEKMTVFCKR